MIINELNWFKNSFLNMKFASDSNAAGTGTSQAAAAQAAQAAAAQANAAKAGETKGETKGPTTETSKTQSLNFSNFTTDPIGALNTNKTVDNSVNNAVLNSMTQQQENQAIATPLGNYNASNIAPGTNLNNQFKGKIGSLEYETQQTINALNARGQINDEDYNNASIAYGTGNSYGMRGSSVPVNVINNWLNRQNAPTFGDRLKAIQDLDKSNGGVIGNTSYSSNITNSMSNNPSATVNTAKVNNPVNVVDKADPTPAPTVVNNGPVIGHNDYTPGTPGPINGGDGDVGKAKDDKGVSKVIGSNKTVDNGSLSSGGSGSLQPPSRDTSGIGLATYNKDSANYDNDNWNRGMEQQSTGLVSDEHCKAFAIRAFKESPSFKKARIKIIEML